MKTRYMTVTVIAVSAFALGVACLAQSASKPASGSPVMVSLTPVAGDLASKYPMSVTEALGKRRSQRSFAERALTAEELSLLCWAGQGITDPKTGKRAAPSARAVYPLVLYAISDKGLHEYVPADHALKEAATGDMKQKLAEVARQGSMRQAPVVFLIAMDMDKAGSRLGNTAEKSSYLEAGHVAQNILLEATSMGLAGVPATGFDPAKVHEAMGLPANQEVIYLVPVGQPK